MTLMRDAPPATSSNLRLSTERAHALSDDAIGELCEATHAAIIDGGGFGWLNTPGKQALERYYRGLLMVPERKLFVARLDGVIVGSAQLAQPSRNNEAQAMTATLNHTYIAPYARRLGLARMLVQHVEDRARAMGYQVLNLDVPETQYAAIALFESCGFERWGTHPCYARAEGRIARGHFYFKRLQTPDTENR